MTRRTWTEIALALARLHTQLAEHADRFMRQRAVHHARMEGVMLAARAVCRILRRHSTRFDGRYFMEIVATPTGRRSNPLR